MNTHTAPKAVRSFLFILLTIFTSVILLSACAQNSSSSDPTENLEEITIAPTLPTNSESPTAQANTFSFAGVWKYRFSETEDALMVLNGDSTAFFVVLGQPEPFWGVTIRESAFWEADERVFAYGDIVDGEKWFWEHPYEIIDNGVQILDGDQPGFGSMERVSVPSSSDSLPTGVWQVYGTATPFIKLYQGDLWEFSDKDAYEASSGSFSVISNDTGIGQTVLLYDSESTQIASMHLLGNDLAILDDGFTTYLLQK